MFEFIKKRLDVNEAEKRFKKSWVEYNPSLVYNLDLFKLVDIIHSQLSQQKQLNKDKLSSLDKKILNMANVIGFDLLLEVANLKNANSFNIESFKNVVKIVQAERDKRRTEYIELNNEHHQLSKQFDELELKFKKAQAEQKKLKNEREPFVQQSKNAVKYTGEVTREWVDCGVNSGHNCHCARSCHYESQSNWSGYGYWDDKHITTPDHEARQHAATTVKTYDEKINSQNALIASIQSDMQALSNQKNPMLNKVHQLRNTFYYEMSSNGQFGKNYFEFIRLNKETKKTVKPTVQPQVVSSSKNKTDFKNLVKYKLGFWKSPASKPVSIVNPSNIPVRPGLR